MKDAAKLWKWFGAHARSLPWRAGVTSDKGQVKIKDISHLSLVTHHLRDPYRVWLAEIMLQQTQVTTVIPYYEKFLRHYPTLNQLADAPAEKVLSDWAGLGYYARARNLHACAKYVVHELKGDWPRTAAELQQLPGLGPYTAAAVAALAFGENVLAIDGNVARVLSRYGGIKTPPVRARAELLRVGNELLYAPANGGSAEALIELGALVCTPKNPKCKFCPLQKNCIAFAEGTPENYPARVVPPAPDARCAAIIILTNPAGEIFTFQRPEKNLFGGMLGLPSSALQKTEKDHPLFSTYATRAKNIGGFTHILTHIRFEIDVLHVALTPAQSKKCSGGAWLPPATAKKQMPTIFQKALERL